MFVYFLFCSSSLKDLEQPKTEFNVFYLNEEEL